MAIRRRLMAARAGGTQPPAGYRWIAYAESAGSAYVELPFGFDNTDAVEMRAAITSTTADKFMAAPKTWNNNSNRYALCGINGGQFAVGFGSMSTGRTHMGVSFDTNFHTWKYASTAFEIVDLDEHLNVSGAVWGSRTDNIRLFFGYNAPTLGKIAYYKHTVSTDGVTHDIRPIQNLTTGDVEMYDITTKTIMTRSGTLIAPTT